jgi:magnesium transporter
LRVDEVIAINDGQKSFLWLDITDPTHLELEGLSEQYMLPHHAVQDCLDAEHLPKFERAGEMNFVIVRSYDDHAPHDADTVQELTRKIAVFEAPHLVITIHRNDQNFFTELKERWRTLSKIGETCEADHILLEIVKAAIESYERPMHANRDLLEEFEVKVFKHQGDTFEDGYYLKRRANTFKRMLRLTLDILPRVGEYYKDEASFIQDLQEKGARLLYYADEFYDNITSLVNLHLSLSSHRLTMSAFKQNEVMRLLTIFSVIFMPLNLITGIYGMNFDYMPELKWPHGYAYAISLLVFVGMSISIYFYRKGLFKADRPDT